MIKERKKKIILFDMDGVIVNLTAAIDEWMELNPDEIDYYKTNPDHIRGIFKNPKPVDGAIEAIKKLEESGKYEMVIATSSPWGNPEALTHKRLWIEKYFGDLFYKQMHITHRKDMLIGDYLIDDRLANGASEFKGELLRFGWDYENKKWNEYPTWDSILTKLL